MSSDRLSLAEILLRAASQALQTQDRASGALPPGHNGLYHDPETPVRNTAHWLISFLEAQRLSGEPAFRRAAEAALSYLLSAEARPGGTSFFHRQSPPKDSCNGLIGQAWTIEALVFAALRLELEEPLRLAREVFLIHPFDEATGIWRRIEPDGRSLPIDYTFNHQLWFCAMGGLLVSVQPDPDVESRVAAFLARIWDNLELHASGLVVHGLRPRGLRARLKSAAKRVLRPAEARSGYLREIGYHAFNTYGFSILKAARPDEPLWTDRRFRRMVAFLAGDEYAANIGSSLHGFPYNPPGSETAVTAQAFNTQADHLVPTARVRQLVNEQFRRGYDADSGSMSRDTADPVTATARLYELVRLRDLAAHVVELDAGPQPALAGARASL